jgi:hypothetical protein
MAIGTCQNPAKAQAAPMIQPVAEVDHSRMAPRGVGEVAERNVLCAVIGLAFHDLKAPGYRGSARAFFNSEHFDEMCEYLDLNAAMIRAGI